MTIEEREEVTTMRRNGSSYRKIAESLGVSMETVKSYCRRNKITISPLCKECGVAIVQTPGKRKRLFCSDQCRTKWWNAHPELVKKKPYSFYDFTCAYCHKTFTAYGNDHRKYCSHECYINDRFGKSDVVGSKKEGDT
ncbi:MAG: helix-turn-helix domain-containing protein [Lachnospiraceae bacterium]|nr:helix-turn-helix domain-containing protein [Lachnospiraceae bacterium]